MPTQFIEGTNLFLRASLVAQRLKHLPPMRETQVRSLGWEDPLGKVMVTHSSILAWRIPWTESLVGCSPGGCEESDTTERLHQTTSTRLYAGGELQGSPVWQALAGHKRRIPLAVVLPPTARGAGTLIPSAQRFVWAAKQPLGIQAALPFFTHAILLDRAFAHCPRFPTAAPRGSPGRVSVPVWLIIRKDQLSIIGLVSLYLTNYLILRRLIKQRF